MWLRSLAIHLTRTKALSWSRTPVLEIQIHVPGHHASARYVSKELYKKSSLKLSSLTSKYNQFPFNFILLIISALVLLKNTISLHFSILFLCSVIVFIFDPISQSTFPPFGVVLVLCVVRLCIISRCFSFANFFSSSGKPFDRPYNFEKNAKYINGLTEYDLKISEHIPLTQSNIFKHALLQDGHVSQLEFEHLRPGSVVAIR